MSRVDRCLRFAALLALVSPALFAARAPRKPPALDVVKTVNESYQFRKNAEPEMSPDEYALYEKIIAMLDLNREFAMKLLEPMAVGKAEATPAFLFVLGNVHFTGGELDVAAGYYRRAVAALPTFTRAWANLGNLLYTQGKYQEAIECFTRVTASGERDPQSLSLLAYCLERTGRRIGAEMNYVQALGLNPDHVDSLRGLLSLSLDSGQTARAEELLQQLIRLTPQDRQTWVAYGQLLASQERQAEAIGLLESAASLQLLDGEGLALLGDLYVAQGFYPEASRTFTRLHAVDPALAATRRLQQVRTLLGAKQYTEAEPVISVLLDTLPAGQRADALEAEASLRVAQRRWPEARAAYEQVLALDPFRGEALLGLGTALKTLGQPAEAELVFDRASRVPACAYRANLELADLALRASRPARALDFLERAAVIQRTPPLESYIAKLKLVISDHENM